MMTQTHMISGTAFAPSVSRLRLLSLETAAALFLLALFLFLQAAYPKSPGLNVEGAVEQQHQAGQLLETLRQESAWKLLREGRLPSIDLYHGDLMAYPYLPFVAVFGREWMVAKHWPVLWAVLTLLFVFLFARDHFGRPTAVLALALAVIHPSFVMGTRVGLYMESPLQFFSMGALYFGGRWWLTGSRTGLGLAAAFLGFGLSTRLWFYWFIAALGAAALLHAPAVKRRFGPWEPRRLLGPMGAALAGFAVGSAPILYYHIFHGWDFFEGIAASVASHDASYDPFRYLANLPVVLSDVNDLLSGRFLFDRLFDMDKAFHVDFRPNRLYPWVFWTSVITLSFARRPTLRPLPLLFVVMVLLAPLSPRRPYVHLFVLYPFPPLLVGIAGATAFARLKPLRHGRRFLILLVCLLAALAWRDATCLRKYFSQIRSTGTVGDFSDKMYDVADWLKRNHPPGKPLFFFWGAFRYPDMLYFLIPDRDLRCVLTGRWSPGDPEDAIRKLREKAEELGEREVVLVKHYYPMREEMRRLDIERRLSESKIPFRVLSEFTEVDGAPFAKIYSIHFNG